MTDLDSVLDVVFSILEKYGEFITDTNPNFKFSGLADEFLRREAKYVEKELNAMLDDLKERQCEQCPWRRE